MVPHYHHFWVFKMYLIAIESWILRVWLSQTFEVQQFVYVYHLRFTHWPNYRNFCPAQTYSWEHFQGRPCSENNECKRLFLAICLFAIFPSTSLRNFHHSCKLWLLSFDFIKKNQEISSVHLANFLSENKTPFSFGIGFLRNCRKDCSKNLTN